MWQNRIAGIRRGVLLGALGAAVIATAGCNSGDLQLGNSSSSSSSSVTQSPAGVWSGLDSATGLAMTGFVDGSGNADFILANGTQYVGTAQVAGSSISMTLDGYPQFGSQFADGSTYGVGTFSGTVASASTITGTLVFTSSDNTGETSAWSLTYNPLYETAGTLSAISGSYADSPAISTGLDPLAAATVTISAAGALSSQGAASGCVLNGMVSNSDTTHDVYQVSFSFTSCAGSYAELNGVSFTGLANFDGSVTPTQVIMGASGQNSAGTGYALVQVFNGQ